MSHILMFRSVFKNKRILGSCCVLGILTMVGLVPFHALLSRPDSTNSPPLNFPPVFEWYVTSVDKAPNEESRNVGLPVYMATLDQIGDDPSPRGIRSTGTKEILLGTPYYGGWTTKSFYFLKIGDVSFSRYGCTVSRCWVTANRKRVTVADAVLFHARDVTIGSLSALQQNRPSWQKWILYTMEPPWMEIVDWTRLDGLFNWTMTYRNDSDIVARYGFIGKPIARAPSHPPSLDASTRVIAHNKTMGALFLASDCCTDSNREEYVKQLSNHFPVSVLGGCGTDTCRPSESSRCYKQILSPFHFYLAFENAVCKDYVTEKFFNALAYDVIPVVFGGADYSHVAPEGSYIDARSSASPQELARYLWSVMSNKTLYASYFEWKSRYNVYLDPWMCRLCEKLHSHEANLPSVKVGLREWWIESAACSRWDPERQSMAKTEPSRIPCYGTHSLATPLQ